MTDKPDFDDLIKEAKLHGFWGGVAAAHRTILKSLSDEPVLAYRLSLELLKCKPDEEVDDDQLG